MVNEITQDFALTLQEEMRQGMVEYIDQVYSERKIWSHIITEVAALLEVMSPNILTAVILTRSTKKYLLVN